MAWGGGIGSGNLLLGAGDVVAAGFGSLSNIITASLQIASGFSVGTAANVGGSAAAIVGRPEFYVDVSFRGTVYVMPLYRKT